MLTKITRDFTKPRPPIEFTIDGDVFRCQKALPLEQLAKLMSSARAMEGEAENRDIKDVFAKITPIVRVLLKKKSYQLFMSRFQPPLDDEGDIADEDGWEPIDHLQLMEIVKWVVEIYTKGRTESSEDSSSGSENAEPGSSSTAGAPPAESTPPNLIPSDF